MPSGVAEFSGVSGDYWSGPEHFSGRGTRGATESRALRGQTREHGLSALHHLASDITLHAFNMSPYLTCGATTNSCWLKGVLGVIQGQYSNALLQPP